MGLNVNLEAYSTAYWKPLHFACFHGHVDVVKLLIDSEVKLNEQDQDNQTPLHYACWQGHVEIVQLLIDLEGVELNLENDDDSTPLHEACCRGHVEVVKLLVKKGVKIEDQDLYWACWGRHVEVMEILINQGLSLDVKDRNGKTPIDGLCYKNKLKRSYILINYIQLTVLLYF